MKMLFCRHFVFLSMFIFSSSVAVKANAGAFYPVCMLACLLTCESTAVVATVATAGIASPLAASCIAACAAACIPSCFGQGTRVTVLKQGIAVGENIENIFVGDLVLTLQDGKLAWTKVVRNVKTEGRFEFLQIVAHNLKDSSQNQIKVTPEHGLVFVNHQGELTIDSAKHGLVGDKMIAGNGDTMVITAIEPIMMPEKYTLETEEGTAIASGMLITTICNEEVVGGERLFDDTLKNWRMRHNFSKAN